MTHETKIYVVARSVITGSEEDRCTVVGSFSSREKAMEAYRTDSEYQMSDYHTIERRTIVDPLWFNNRCPLMYSITGGDNIPIIYTIMECIVDRIETME